MLQHCLLEKSGAHAFWARIYVLIRYIHMRNTQQYWRILLKFHWMWFLPVTDLCFISHCSSSYHRKSKKTIPTSLFVYSNDEAKIAWLFCESSSHIKEREEPHTTNVYINVILFLCNFKLLWFCATKDLINKDLWFLKRMPFHSGWKMNGFLFNRN